MQLASSTDNALCCTLPPPTSTVVCRYVLNMGSKEDQGSPRRWGITGMVRVLITTGSRDGYADHARLAAVNEPTAAPSSGSVCCAASPSCLTLNIRLLLPPPSSLGTFPQLTASYSSRFLRPLRYGSLFNNA